MGVGTIITGVVLIIYGIFLLKNKELTKKQKKWLYAFTLFTLCVAVLLPFKIYLNDFTDLLNRTIGELTKSVVD